MGPLAGIKVIEMAGLAPGPFGAMMLADMGAEVLRIDRPDAPEAKPGARPNLVNRNRRAIAVDIKSKDGLATLRRLIASADALIEGFRPGVMERLGLGPDDCLAANPRLVYGRVTGWGQDGPLARAAGHDVNYIALAGALTRSAPRMTLPFRLTSSAISLAAACISPSESSVRCSRPQNPGRDKSWILLWSTAPPR